jgi:hypothetical protein
VTDSQVVSERLQIREVQREKERKKKSFIAQLKKEERDQNAAHVEKQRLWFRSQSAIRLSHDEERLQAMEKEKEQLRLERQEKLIHLEKQRHAMQLSFNDQLAPEHLSMDSLKRFAQQYGVDFEQVQKSATPTPRPGSARRGITISRVSVSGRQTPV